MLNGEDVDFEDAERVSFVNGSTYGQPSWLDDGPVTALYVNASAILALEATVAP